MSVGEGSVLVMSMVNISRQSGAAKLVVRDEMTWKGSFNSGIIMAFAAPSWASVVNILDIANAAGRLYGVGTLSSGLEELNNSRILGTIAE